MINEICILLQDLLPEYRFERRSDNTVYVTVDYKCFCGIAFYLNYDLISPQFCYDLSDPEFSFEELACDIINCGEICCPYDGHFTWLSIK